MCAVDSNRGRTRRLEAHVDVGIKLRDSRPAPNQQHAGECDFQTTTVWRIQLRWRPPVGSTPPDAHHAHHAHPGRRRCRSGRRRTPKSWVARMLDRPACEMVASGSTQPHAPDYPNHTTGTDLDFLRNKPLEAVPPAVANNALGRRSNRFGYEIEATRHELDEKMPALGASHLFTVTSRATRPFVPTSHAPLRPDPVFRESEPAAHPAAAQN